MDVKCMTFLLISISFSCYLVALYFRTAERVQELRDRETRLEMHIRRRDFVIRENLSMIKDLEEYEDDELLRVSGEEASVRSD